jgi:hypothetical protein
MLLDNSLYIVQRVAYYFARKKLYDHHHSPFCILGCCSLLYYTVTQCLILLLRDFTFALKLLPVKANLFSC